MESDFELCSEFLSRNKDELVTRELQPTIVVRDAFFYCFPEIGEDFGTFLF
jgi:hypothetical protein